ncbi:MAG: hypothetical protein M5U01_23950 [Ardenticatenaceae bacterium]|nr:hypothetical protein [Ardenticatenaceae bacterium]
MMQRDYYASRLRDLSDSLNALEQAAEALEKAKQQRDRNARDQAENQMKQTAGEAVRIEPHLAYLWFEAHTSELDNSIRDAWQESLTASTIPQAFHFTPDASAITYLPPLSFTLRIPFQLQKPYLSKDEQDFYLLDNPLRKEKVFQTPMVAATSWKGALRAALWQFGYKGDHEVAIRLLGNPRGSDEHQAGRLYFYPTFFDQIGLEVINPHSRETGIGERGPILMECVPKGTATLLLLYVPFDPVEQSEQNRRAAVARDLEVLAEGVQVMLITYGFGAKTSSGYGTVEDRLAGGGTLAMRAELAGEATSAAAPPEPPPPDLPRYLESPTRLHADLRRPDGSLKSEAEYQALIESRGQKYAKKGRQLYDKAKGWWEREGRKLAQATPQEPEPKLEPAPTEKPSVAEYTFRSLSELCDLARRVAGQLRDGGDE